MPFKALSEMTSEDWWLLSRDQVTFKMTNLDKNYRQGCLTEVTITSSTQWRPVILTQFLNNTFYAIVIKADMWKVQKTPQFPYTTATPLQFNVNFLKAWLNGMVW